MPGAAKYPTGIHGLDDITGGGWPRGRPTLVCGSAGSGKTLLAIEFIVRGAGDYGEPGVFMAFQEKADELADNIASLGFDLPDLFARKKLVIDHIRGSVMSDRTGKEWELRLYIAGKTPLALQAFANLRKICKDYIDEGAYEIDIIDLLEKPQLAQGDQILAVPTLVRRLPEPVRKIIGDLSNTERVLVGLDIRERRAT